jgi:hypothetical protein
VLLDEMLVDENWAAAGGQTKYEWSFSCRTEGLDAFCKAWTLVTCLMRKGAAVVCTNDVVRNVLACSLRIVANDQPHNEVSCMNGLMIGDIPR